MNEAIIVLGAFAFALAWFAVATFVRTYRKPPPPQDLDREWLEK